jgi:microsomal dipeptidase-like Zn-dependent dipeptidase
MHQSRLFALSVTLIATLLTWQSSTAQVPARQARPVAPIETRLPPAPPPNLLPAWVFADIHVTVLGPNSVKIDWVPYPQGFVYHLKRNGVEINSFSSAPNETRVGTAIDDKAPANATLTYSVAVQYHGEKIPDRSGNVLIGDGSTESKIVTIVTPPGAVAHPLTAAAPVAVAAAGRPTVAVGLTGWVDLHAHPMSHLAFGGKVVQGGVDITQNLPFPNGSLLPMDSNCVPWMRAASVAQALGDDRPTHGGHDVLHFPCGDELRVIIINGLQSGNKGALMTAGTGAPPTIGFPVFNTWPAWNDITHQKMWWEWIKRARDGGQRVMVALAHNNRTLADAVSGDQPTTDRESADLQIREIRTLAAAHSDVMEVALDSAHLQQIVLSNRIAIVLGVEIDNIGNFSTDPALNTNPPLPPQLRDQLVQARMPGEIQHLYDEGVRYIFPVHIVDNSLGGTAIYEPTFDIPNFRETGHYWAVECSAPNEEIDYTFDSSLDTKMWLAAIVKLGIDPTKQPSPSPTCRPDQGQGLGHRNALGITPAGVAAIKEMMKRGMIIDIDHMSDKTADATLDLAEAVGGPGSPGYPVVSGHAGIRRYGGASERFRSTRQLARIAKLHGMFGLGTDGTFAYDWANQYQAAMYFMGYMNANPSIRALYKNGAIAFGTDANGFTKMPMPGGNSPPAVTYTAAFPQSGTSGSLKTWNYNTEGVANYGMLWDFIQHVRRAPPNGSRNDAGQPSGVTGQDLVDNHLYRGADYFFHMWQQCEAQRANVR